MTELGQNPPASRSTRRLLYVAPEDWFFESHFLGLARAARAAGHELGLVTRMGPAARRLEAEGIRLFPLAGARGSLSLWGAFQEVRALRQAMQAFQPDLVHVITIRSIMLALAARFGLVRNALVMAPTGLGYLFSGNRLHLRLLRGLLKRAMQHPLACSGAVLLAENRDDPVVLGFPTRQIAVVVVGGAGIPLAQFAALPMPGHPPFRLATVARMLRSKGILVAAEALNLARQQNAAIELHLYGKPDPANPTTLSEAELARLAQTPGLHWHGETADIAGIWAQNHAALLLSEREGMPRMLAEAAASARPIIATDVAGCREIVEPRRNGFLVPPGSAESAARAMLDLAGDPQLACRMGLESRQMFEESFTLEAVSGVVLQVYASLPGRARP
jgi:glycosyltransferase involved in cell wall biosynthesis